MNQCSCAVVLLLLLLLLPATADVAVDEYREGLFQLLL
jgi:hypothetical protein